MPRPSGWVASLVLLAGLAAACGGAGNRSPAESPATVPYELQGFYMLQPQVKPEFVLTDTAGRPFDLQLETAGSVTLLYFGYTNCPDICPVHMATVAAALDQVPGSVRDAVRVVFVTTDPDRDHPDVIREWLDHFDPSFVGLTGTLEELVAAQQAAGVPVAQVEPSEQGGYAVSHAAQVIAYTPDGLAHVVYPFGTRQSNWAHDLPILVKVGSPGGPWSADVRGLVVSAPVMPAPAREDVGAVYLTVENTGTTDDALIGGSTPLGATVELHVTEREGGTAIMRPVDELPVPAGGELRLEPGGAHLMLTDIPEEVRAGDVVLVQLSFRHAGTIAVAVPVVPYEDLTDEQDMPTTDHVHGQEAMDHSHEGHGG